MKQIVIVVLIMFNSLVFVHAARVTMPNIFKKPKKITKQIDIIQPIDVNNSIVEDKQQDSSDETNSSAQSVAALDDQANDVVDNIIENDLDMQNVVVGNQALENVDDLGSNALRGDVSIELEKNQDKNEATVIANVVTVKQEDKKNPSLDWLVAASYAPLDDAAAMMQEHGYVMDKDLSNGEAKVFYYQKNDSSYQLLVLFRGSQSAGDWNWTDPMLGLGHLKKTPRYKRSIERLEKAKKKYTVNGVRPLAILVGHSLGGALASTLGLEPAYKKDYVITYNKGVGIANLVQKSNPNEIAYRTKGDVVSLVGKYNKNIETLKPSKKANDIIKKHNDTKVTQGIEVSLKNEQ